MNQSNKIFSIVKQFLSHRFPSETEERVQRWIIKDEHSKEKEAASLDYWNELESEINSDTYLALEHVNTRIDNMQQNNSVIKNEDPLSNKQPLIRKLSRVAAILIPVILIARGYFYFSSFNQLIEIETAYGEERHLILPDSSQIWLNAGTILKYPKKFKGQKRVVHLNGEAYFSVKKDDSKTFIVETGDLSVTVLGTQFNVKAYANEQRITTTLTSGKVEVRTPENDIHILKPNEQLTYNRLSSSTNVMEIVVTSSKEVTLTISLEEESHTLSEVVIYPQTNKDMPLNKMALTGGRLISMEEAGRFANGFDDPARLASAFAGVAGDVGTNAIAIRGNSPQYTQWRMEGVEIPNPTHFADLSGLGGGIFSALSSQVMGNSDFYNGGMPAEYQNALSGVFDIYMRSGNTQQHEHTFQAGLLGFDIASEGPINKKQGSSYIFNYRLSNTSLATGGETTLKYQDLSFKLNLPTHKAGTFSVWGLGLHDRDEAKALDPED